MMNKTEMTKCSIGILIHNEAANIGKLLTALLDQKLSEAIISEIVVVSSASTDGSDEIVRGFCSREKIIKLVTEPERKGKSYAINTFLKEASEEIVIISSGDVIPSENCIELLVKPFKNSSVGMTGCHPQPTNNPKTFTGFIVHLQWRLHHQIALKSPKLGEMVAFRNIITEIPADSAVDEASIEAIITANGYTLSYAPEAIVYNHGPESITEFIKQRKRIAAGHLWLKNKQMYHVSTNSPLLLAKVLLNELAKKPWHLPLVAVAMLLEIWARILGWFDLKIKKKNPYKWEIIGSTKKLG
jgi:poly-beta-1,6-N-acetyl-D-glucosamine synthase